MHRSLKPHASTAQAKKVQPPTIPGDSPQDSHHYQQPQLQLHQQHQHHHHHHPQHQPLIPLYRLSGPLRHHQNHQADDGISMSGSSIVSSPSLEEGGFNLPRETSVALRLKDEVVAAVAPSPGGGGGAGVGAPAVGAPPTGAGKSGVAMVPPPPVFCATLREPLTHKAAVYYHQQLALQEDQGIDLTQSPGRDSPGSSSGSAGSGSRHSTASLDSGRASSYLTGVSSSGASIRAPLSSPRCSSVSSCSIGSVDRQRNDELIIDWLLEMKHEEYAQLFIAAGYDLPTIARMTPEDLTAIGIKNPHHRERIKQRIDKLQVLDNLPHFVPGSIEEWLQLLRLEEYIQPLLEQNYKTVRDVTQVTWEDLEDIGIVKLGHQKKILLAIKRVKDIISGKWNPGGANAYQQQEYQRKPWQFNVPIPSTPSYVPTTRVSWDDTKIYATSSSVLNATAPAGSSCLNSSLANGDAYYCTGSNHECCSGNDVVLIKVRQPRGKSLESLEDIHDNSTRSHLTFSHYTTTDYGHFGPPTTAAAAAAMAAAATLQQQQHHHQQLLHQQQQQQAAAARLLGSNAPGIGWRRSYDDGDITPTNDATRELLYEQEGGGTLPRQQRGILQRAVLNTMPPLEHHHYMNAAAAAEYGAASGAEAGANYISGSPLTGKKIAPEPPRRHCSIRNSRTLSGEGVPPGSVAQVHQQAAQQQQQQQQAQHMFYGHTAQHWQQQQAAGAGSGQQPIYANYATIQQTTAEIHCEKYHDNKSTSSIDSIDTIPFANENTGTIKQRLLNRQEMQGGGAGTNNVSGGVVGGGGHPVHLHSSSSSSSSSSTNTIANIAHSFHSLKSSSSLHDATLARSESMGSTASGGSALHLRSPTLDMSNAGGSAVEAISSPELAVPAVAHNSSSGVPPKVSVNVLNDIGNMLANLTDELDAMLEEEKRVGLNIDSE
ncbi:uncharacterized protein LOC128254405 isoform X1 [Drosophila gunungcola]|uniref:SAM domain-containing protein n=1 Tax=Drosophila gunungcola TaxID=103775 RepID=A0A9P9YNB0_9MUSC|nr:uncharacterized protein LOC128254405 isoform X1 [Drosophila gunungcola]XP_052839461.1 uncharacterized protein LOC128254405 isoform X1 [Drosophila gunungcola]XP_052839462.1 uncharacterized protein LOC128254405 isoform X1 [Drosophila gunungcola]KAI8040062.1 hypothetical protein M5D96_007490 [Drosophila gunungcola]